MRRRKCCKLRVGWTSLDSAANLLGMTRTAHGLLTSGGKRVTSGGVLFSFPAQNGQVSKKAGAFCAGRCAASSSGRLARSVAMMTHSLVKKFWRSSGMATPQLQSSAECEGTVATRKSRPESGHESGWRFGTLCRDDDVEL